MEKTNDFAAHVAASAQAQEHALEIQQTRVGGLGGSDAAMVLRIAERGLNGLSATDTKRLCVMLDKIAPDNWGGNAYTNAGHAFEDFAEQNLPWGKTGYERERVMTAELAKNFKVFAHADFATPAGVVIECKFVQKETPQVIAEYFAQLQWYYMLGAKDVRLYHGTGTAEPFEVATGQVVEIERDEATISALIGGLKALDDALAAGWEPIVPDKIAIDDAPQMIRDAFQLLETVKEQESRIKADKEAAAKVLKEYMEGWGITGIVSAGETKHQVTYTRASVSRTFDAAKFLKEHPEFNDVPAYWKQTTRSASVTFK